MVTVEPGWRRLVVSVAEDNRLSQLAAASRMPVGSDGHAGRARIALRASTQQASLRSNTQP